MKTLAALYFLLATPALAASDTDRFEAKDIKKLVVENASGDVSVRATTGAQAIVSSNRGKMSGKCEIELNKNGDTLYVKVDQKGSGFSTSCTIDFKIEVPKNVDVSLSSGSGEINVAGISGDLSVKTGSGDIEAEGIFKAIQAKTGSGDINVKGLQGGGKASTGSGSVDLTFTTANLKGSIDVSTGSGEATLAFPKDSKISTSFRAGSGDVRNEIGDTKNADFKVSVKTGSGDLQIKAF